MSAISRVWLSRAIHRHLHHQQNVIRKTHVRYGRVRSKDTRYHMSCVSRDMCRRMTNVTYLTCMALTCDPYMRQSICTGTTIRQLTWLSHVWLSRDARRGGSRIFCRDTLPHAIAFSSPHQCQSWPGSTPTHVADSSIHKSMPTETNPSALL